MSFDTSWEDLPSTATPITAEYLSAVDAELRNLRPNANGRLGLNLTKVGVVLPRGAGGTWDADMVEAPSVMYDPKSAQWVMVYVGYGTTSGAQRAGVGLATSPDGVTWTKVGSAAILPHSGTSGAPDQNGATGPVLFWDDDAAQYVLYYIGLTSTGYESGTKTICYATATTLTGSWTRQGSVVTAAGSGWRNTAVWHVSIVRREATWYMFFNATGSDSKEKIGYATAPALTGPWTVDDVNSPVLSPVSSTWESSFVGDPCVRRIGDMWVMDYYGYDGASAGDGVAVTSDSAFPLGWVKYAGNPVLAPTSGTFDGKYAHKPYVLERGGELFHYYTAVDASDVRQIALAMEGPRVDTTAEAERVRDVIGSALVAGSNVTITVSDAGDTITVAAASGGGTGSELLMQDGVTGPPVPIENEDRSDWLYKD